MRSGIEERAVDVTDDAASDAGEGFVVETGEIGLGVSLDRERLVVAHLLEVRHAPIRVGGVAMESAAELIVDAARGDFPEAVERDRGELQMAVEAVREREPQRLEVVEFRSR